MRPNNRKLRKMRGDTGVIRVFPVDEMVQAVREQAAAEEEAKRWETERGSFVSEEIERRKAEAKKSDSDEESKPRLQESAKSLSQQESVKPRPQPEDPKLSRQENLKPRMQQEAARPRDIQHESVKPAKRNSTTPRSRREAIQSRERMRRARKRKQLLKLLPRVIIPMVILVAVFHFFDAARFSVPKPKTKTDLKKEAGHEVTLPALKTKDIVIGYGKDVTPEDFLKDPAAKKDYSYSFEKKPDATRLNKKQKVVVQAEDKEGNFANGKATLVVLALPGDVEVEAGAEPEAVLEAAKTRFETDAIQGVEYITTNHVDRFLVNVKKDEQDYEADVAIVDTIAPIFAVRDLKCNVGYEVTAKEFVTESEDATDITYSFAAKPKLSGAGRHALTIIGEDEGGNRSRHTAFLQMAKDKTPPVFEGGEDFTSFIGDSITYKDKVSVIDDFDGEITIKVDSSKVDPTKEGTYPVKYTAVDAAGNKSEYELNITLTDYSAEEQEVVKKADEIIASIITDDMSDRDKAWAIYEYILNHVSYVSSSEKGDYLKAARQGLVNGSGDCYVYRSVAKLLLDEAGLTNMDIERIPSGNDMHYWNLVDVHDGHGWYHYDTTPRIDHPTIFLWDDATTKAYSDAHNNCHNYDRSLYPAIP